MITRDDSLAVDEIPKHSQRPDHVLNEGYHLVFSQLIPGRRRQETNLVKEIAVHVGDALI